VFLNLMFIVPCIIFDSWIKCFSLHKDTTPPQPNHTITPAHIEPQQYNPWNKSTISRKLLRMDVLTFETCWAVNSEIIKQVPSSWSIFIQLCIFEPYNDQSSASYQICKLNVYITCTLHEICKCMWFTSITIFIHPNTFLILYRTVRTERDAKY
jgi:hypothetical protein